MKIVAVGFKVSQENSVYYRKFEIPQNYSPPEIRQAMGQIVYQAWLDGSEFVSVRFI